MTIVWASLHLSMKLWQIKFPVYVLHSDEIEERDGLLFCDTQIVDDKNMSGNTLGKRRLQSPHKNLYPLRYMIEDFSGLIRHRGKFFIDTKGKFFRYTKSTKADIKYKKIEKVEKKEVITLIWVKDIPFPFEEKRPQTAPYAGVAYLDGTPSFIYEYVSEKKKDTWRKI